jgi:hypothetical protein
MGWIFDPWLEKQTGPCLFNVTAFRRVSVPPFDPWDA